jgi:hypothetical protein
MTIYNIVILCVVHIQIFWFSNCVSSVYNGVCVSSSFKKSYKLDGFMDVSDVKLCHVLFSVSVYCTGEC